MANALHNRAAVRKWLLAYAERSHRAGAFSRVSSTFFDDLDAHIRKFVRARVDAHPSSFKTLE